MSLRDRIIVGAFLKLRAKNADTPEDPWDPLRESPLEKNLPDDELLFTGPKTLPPPPAVQLSSPTALPGIPGIQTSIPASLPAVPPVVLSVPSALPPAPNVNPSVPSALPGIPSVIPSVPGTIPPPPLVSPSVPGVLPPPPNVNLSSPGILPPPPAVAPGIPLVLPAPPPFTPQPTSIMPAPNPIVTSIPAELPPIPEVKTGPKHSDSVVPLVPERLPPGAGKSGYQIDGDVYSRLGAADPGVLADDPIQYERQLERMTRGDMPGKMTLHAMKQTFLFAMNKTGNVWNPALLAPPPIVQNFLLPALDLPFPDGRTEGAQTQIKKLVEDAIDNRYFILDSPIRSPRGNKLLGTLPGDDSLGGKVKKAGLNALALADGSAIGSGPPTSDDLVKSSFSNGIVPAKFGDDNKFGFVTSRRGEDIRNKVDDDKAYVPVSFTDLRPVGSTFRTVYIRPFITSLSEEFSPEWNKSQYIGRVDPVATYQSTTRTINMSFVLVAFGPEDVRTIYQKMHWLSSMVYPEYDKNLMYKSGPVVRMRVGDVISATGPEGTLGLPGVIDSLSFDYSESLWELKKTFKVPRNINVSLSFTVLHDSPVGRGKEGRFGGFGNVDDSGFQNPFLNEDTKSTTDRLFRRIGEARFNHYETLDNADKEI